MGVRVARLVWVCGAARVAFLRLTSSPLAQDRECDLLIHCISPRREVTGHYSHLEFIHASPI